MKKFTDLSPNIAIFILIVSGLNINLIHTVLIHIVN